MSTPCACLCLGLTSLACGGGREAGAPDATLDAADATPAPDAADAPPPADGVDVAPDADVAVGDLPVGSPCTSASACAPGLICVYRTLADPGPTCVDPTVGWYDNGTDPAKRMVRSGDWVRKRVDTWEADGARCNDGSPYAYFVSPGSGSGANRWIIFFKGGGACAGASCALRWAAQPQYMRDWRTAQLADGETPNYGPGSRDGVGGGLYSRTGRTDGPVIPNVMGNWNVVHLHYCTSDVFAGTTTAAENELRLWFRGRAVVTSVLRELLDGFDTSAHGFNLPSLAQAEVVLVAGGSAGAAGARHNMDAIASMIKARNPATVVRGHADAAFAPPIRPESYATDVSGGDNWRALFDADCEAAHPDQRYLCADGVHLVNGHGLADFFGGVDNGHLGVAAAGETGAVDAFYIAMATRDGKALPAAGAIGMCVRSDECASNADCGAASACMGGKCLAIAPCEAAYCTPDDGVCFGRDDPPVCIAGVASHASECDQGATCPGVGCCPTGEVCDAGYCVQPGFGPCVSSTECPAGFACASGLCMGAADGSDDCPTGYNYEPDTGTCDQIPGCSATNPCGAGYACLAPHMTPWGQTFAAGVIRELSGLATKNGAWVALSWTHTMTSGAKYYGVNMERVRGKTPAEAMNAWMQDPSGAVDFVATLEDLPVPLWAWEVTGIQPVGVGLTSGTGCANQAVVVGLCDVASPCTSLADPLAVLTIGDSATRFMAGSPPAGGAPLKLVVAANPTCGSPSLELAANAHLIVTYRYGPDAGATHTVKVPLTPQGAALEVRSFPQTAYLGAAGTSFAEPTLETVLGSRLE